jgi:hypothetical protein
MNNLVEFDLIQRQQALTKWLVESQRRMGLKYPKIDFESDHWPIRTFYKTDQPVCSFTETFADFELKDRCFCDVVRCMMAEIVIEEKPKDIRRALTGFRLLKTSRAQSVFEVTMHDLRKIEEDCVSQAKANPIRANQIRGLLSLLERHIPMLSEKQVIPSLGFHLRHVVKVELTNLAISHLNKKNKDRSTILDRKIEAFNDAINALIRNDPRLSAIDRVALCASMRLMCAPSRINEILCSSIYDHVTVEDYAKKAEGKETD